MSALARGDATPGTAPVTRRSCLRTATTVAIAGGGAIASAHAGAKTTAAASMLPGGATASFTEREVSFTSGADTLFGSLLGPPAPAPGTPGRRVPAALLLAGSGPTDRNGNNPLINGPVNTLQGFAFALADLGIASLRYDKLGTGKTGLGSHTNAAEIGFDTFVDEARAAYEFLRAQERIDPSRTLVLGHSEGGLIALVLADQVKNTAPVRALVLAAPPGAPYLDLIRRQLTEQYAAAQLAGAVTADQAAAALAELDAIISQLLATGSLPDEIATPALKVLFNPSTQRFLAQAATYDPAALAADLPAALPVLILRGQKDQQVDGAGVQRLLQGFRAGGNARATLYELRDADHVFKEVPGTPNPALDYGNPDLPFSREAVSRLEAFVRSAL